MIDMEDTIYAEIYEKVMEKYPDVFMTGEYVPAPSEFPCVSLIEEDNATYRNSQTQDSEENHVAVTYELNVYSNEVEQKKAQCREIAGFVDDLLRKLNFTRMMLRPIPNLNDATIYRLFGRYRAVISKEHIIFRR